MRAAGLHATHEPSKGVNPLRIPGWLPAIDMAGVRRGVWGEGGVAPGSPQGYTAKVGLWQRGPSRAPVAHEKRAPLCGGSSSIVATAITE